MARGSRSRVVGRVRSVLIVGTFLVAGLGGTARAESLSLPADDAYYVSNGDWYDEHLYAGNIPGRDNILAATVLRFGPEAALPPGAQIESATLRLYNVAGNDELSAFRIEGTLPGNTYDPWFHEYLAGPLDTVSISSSGGWNSWDVTAAVRAWVAGTESNDGLAVYRRSGGWAAFDDVWAGATAPSLDISYEEDRTPPDVELEGTLYEERATQLIPDLYDLGIAADDTFSDVDRAEVRLDGALVFTATPDLPCDVPTCNVDVDDYLLDATAFSGDHLFEVKAFDEAGNVTTIAWTANFDGVGEPFVPTEPVGTDPDGGAAGSTFGPTFALGCSFSSRSQSRGAVDLATTAVRHG
jgi:hypothetical protein